MMFSYKILNPEDYAGYRPSFNQFRAYNSYFHKNIIHFQTLKVKFNRFYLICFLYNLKFFGGHLICYHHKKSWLNEFTRFLNLLYLSLVFIKLFFIADDCLVISAMNYGYRLLWWVFHRQDFNTFKQWKYFPLSLLQQVCQNDLVAFVNLWNYELHRFEWNAHYFVAENLT